MEDEAHILNGRYIALFGLVPHDEVLNLEQLLSGLQTAGRVLNKWGSHSSVRSPLALPQTWIDDLVHGPADEEECRRQDRNGHTCREQQPPDVQTPQQIALGLSDADHETPAHLDVEKTEETKHRLERNRLSDPEHHVQEAEREHVGDDVAKDQVPAGSAGHPGGVHERLDAHRQGLGSQHNRHSPEPIENTDDHAQLPELNRPESSDDDEDRNERHEQDEVGDSHEERVDEAAEKRRHRPHRRGDEHRHKRSHHPEKEGSPGREHELRKDITAQRVGPEQVTGRRPSRLLRLRDRVTNLGVDIRETGVDQLDLSERIVHLLDNQVIDDDGVVANDRVVDLLVVAAPDGGHEDRVGDGHESEDPDDEQAQEADLVLGKKGPVLFEVPPQKPETDPPQRVGQRDLRQRVVPIQTSQWRTSLEVTRFLFQRHAGSLLVPDPRIEENVQHINHDMGDERQRADHRERADRHRNVLSQHRVEQQLPHPRPREHGLGDEAAADDERQAEHKRRGHRQEGITGGMTVTNRLGSQALGTGGEDVVLLQGLQHRTPGDQHDPCERHQSQRKYGKQGVVGDVGGVDPAVAGVFGRRAVTAWLSVQRSCHHLQPDSHGFPDLEIWVNNPSINLELSSLPGWAPATDPVHHPCPARPCHRSRLHGIRQ